MAVTGSERGGARPGRRRPGQVQLASWVGVAGARAAEAARGMGFRPAMELVEAEADVGLVVAQEPRPGSLVERNALVTLFIAAPAERNVGPGPVIEVERGGDAAEERLFALDEDDGGLEEANSMAVAGLDRGGRNTAPLNEENGRPAAQGSDESQRPDEAERPRERRDVGDARGGAQASRAKARQRLVRVRWLVVVGGWRVWWLEGLAAAAVALLAAWAVGGSRALAGALAAAGVIGALTVCAAVAGWGEEAAESRAATAGRGAGEALVLEIESARRSR